MAETTNTNENGNCANRVLACRYCIIGFEYNEPMKHAAFFRNVIDDEGEVLETTDDWDKVTYFDSLTTANYVRCHLKEDFPDYGWYVLICNAR